MSDAKEILGQLITYAKDMGATDLHVSPGMVPDVVVRGSLYGIEEANPVKLEQLNEWVEAFCPSTKHQLEGPDGACDGAVTVGQVRVRCAFRRQWGGIALTARLLPLTPPWMRDLDVPNAVADLVHRPAGLVIVSGPTGAGKSTLLAAMVNDVNAHQGKHVMTIEEPIEFLHRQGRSRISQREVGSHVGSFGDALRAALRARPDIVVVGEMRDAETARAALEAATKGQLVLTTSHASSATDALEGMISLFPGVEQRAAAARIAATVQAIVVQRLVPNADDSGVVPVRELLLRTDGIAAIIRSGELHPLYNALAPSPDAPMFRLEDDLEAKVTTGQITVEVAMRVANKPAELKAKLDHVARRAGAR